MAVIKLTQGHETLVDAADFDWLNSLKWSVYQGKNAVYARHSFRDKGKVQSFMMHQLLMMPEPGMTVDHINRNSLDNRRANLRVATYTENNQNRKVWGSSIFRGVCFDKSSKKWQAEIGESSYLLYLGLFDSELEAHNAIVQVQEDYAEFSPSQVI